MDYKRLWVALLVGNAIYAFSILVGVFGLGYAAAFFVPPMIVVSLYSVAWFSGVERRGLLVVAVVISLIVLGTAFDLLAKELSSKYMAGVFAAIGVAFAIALKLESRAQIATRVSFVLAVGILGAFIRAPGQGARDSRLVLVLFIPILLALWEQVWGPLLVSRAADASAQPRDA